MRATADRSPGAGSASSHGGSPGGSAARRLDCIGNAKRARMTMPPA
jgi:hypothetical protein